MAVKTEGQQAALALHRMRQQLVKFRTMQSNGLRGLLTEYGEVMAVGQAALNRADRRNPRHRPVDGGSRPYRFGRKESAIER